jgi:hypothetical protein
MKVQLEATRKAKQLGEVNMYLTLCYPIKVCQVVVNSLQVFLVKLFDSHLGAVYQSFKNIIRMQLSLSAQLL